MITMLIPVWILTTVALAVLAFAAFGKPRAVRAIPRQLRPEP